MNDFDKELLKNGVSKEDIDDFNKMSEQEVRIEKLEKEIEILKKRVDYFYEEIRPYIVIDRCKYKHVVSDEKSNGHICYEKQDCFNCEYLHKK